MKLRPRHIWIGIAVLVLVPILVPLITLGGAKARILQALQAGLGRRIEAGEIHLVAFPLPGVELDQVRLGEDPRFGAEDMVVADSATAAVRFSSLFSGRLAFARIQLERPSINLVRNAAGQWNITALLDRTSQGRPVRGGARLRAAAQFPYLVWSDARINFKLDQTKTRFYLDQVQGSLVHDSGGWRLQARFQPARTDLNLSDTGEVTVDGRWPGAPTGAGFPQQPFDLALRIQNSFLAGSSALIVGHDAGVHGILSAEIHVHGSGHDFLLGGTLQAQAVRRWDLLPPPATVRASFNGTYYPTEERFHLDGLGDPGFQHLRLAGDVRNLFTRPDAALTLQLRQFAAGNLIAVVRAVKANLPADLALGWALQ
ncbi:MAG TPA: AsmA family protein, partial [Terriglobales bacterium]|nr:AsmA family protein [Terriglobales bacterium]